MNIIKFYNSFKINWVIFFFAFFTIGCSNDDDDESQDLCERQTNIEGAVISNIEFGIEENDNNSLYFASAMVTNTSEIPIDGFGILVFTIFGEQSIGASISCPRILPDESCTLVTSAMAIGDPDINFNVDCAFYVLPE